MRTVCDYRSEWQRTCGAHRGISDLQLPLSKSSCFPKRKIITTNTTLNSQSAIYIDNIILFTSRKHKQLVFVLIYVASSTWSQTWRILTFFFRKRPPVCSGGFKVIFKTAERKTLCPVVGSNNNCAGPNRFVVSRQAYVFAINCRYSVRGGENDEMYDTQLEIRANRVSF